jgi:hypothetical protein
MKHPAPSCAGPDDVRLAPEVYVETTRPYLSPRFCVRLSEVRPIGPAVGTSDGDGEPKPDQDVIRRGMEPG